MKKLLTALSGLLALALSSARAELAVGDPAPAFAGKDQDGKSISSAELYKEGTTLVFFYPKAGTGG